MSDLYSITYEDAIAVTASDSTNDPAGPFVGFFTGSGGTIRFATYKTGRDVTMTNLPAGVIVPVPIRRVYSSTTTATGVLGLIGAIIKPAVSS